MTLRECLLMAAGESMLGGLGFTYWLYKCSGANSLSLVLQNNFINLPCTRENKKFKSPFLCTSIFFTSLSRFFVYINVSFYDYRDQLLGVAQPDGAVSSSHIIIILFKFFVQVKRKKTNKYLSLKFKRNFFINTVSIKHLFETLFREPETGPKNI